MISKCWKLKQLEYKIRYKCVGKVIHSELCKRLIFEHPDKWYMHKKEFFLENEGLKSTEFAYGSPNAGQKTRSSFNEEKKVT